MNASKKSSLPASAPSWVVRALMGAVRGYQLTIGVVMTPSCRFFPSCSSYCIEALATHGPIKGLVLGGRRIARCHPWHPGGVDLVPAAAARANVVGRIL